MAHTKVTKAHSAHTGVANTYSYSGSFDTFKATEVVVTLDTEKLTYTASTINDSASPREYTVDYTAKTIHIGGADLSSGTIVISPETDLGSPTPRATYSPGASVTSEDLNNNQLQLLRRAMEYEEQVLFTTGGVMTGVLGIGPGSAVQFEGDTVDGNDTNLTAEDPTGTNSIVLPNRSGTVITSGDTGTVTATMLAANSVDSSELVAGSIDTEHLAGLSVTGPKIVSETITAGKLATDSVETAKIKDHNVTTAKIADGAVVGDKIGDNQINTNHIVNDAIGGALIGDNQINSEHYVDGSIDAAHIADLNVTTAKIADNAITFTKIGCEQTTISDTDTSIPTSGAVVDYVTSVIAPIGGFEVIADEESFPNTIPAAGVVISITDAAGLQVNSSGVSTNADALDNSTITINGFPSELRGGVGANADPYVFQSGAGLMVQSTGSSHTYNYHQAMIRESDFVQLSDDINDFNNRYRINNGEPGSNNDDGDLVWDTNVNRIKVYNSSTSAWEELHSAGDFKSLYLCPAGGSGAPTLNGSIATYDLRESSNSGAVANVTRAQQLIVSINGVVQKANTGTSAPAEGFALVDTNTIIFGANLATGDSVFIVQIGTAISLSVPADDSVTTNKIAADAITGAKIADDTIDSEHYVHGSIDTDHLAGNSVTGAKIVNDSINADKIADDAVGSEHIEVLDAALQFGDDVKAQFGASQDLNIWHETGSNIFESVNQVVKIRPKTGEEGIMISPDTHVKLYYDNAEKLATSSWGVDVTGTLVASNNIRVNSDSHEFSAGAGQDLTMKHNGNDSYISTATGDLYLDAATNIFIRPKANENGIKLIADGAVELYHNANKQLETTSAGIQLNGSGAKITRSANSDDPFIELTNAQYTNSLYIGGWSTSNDADISRIRNSNDNLHIDCGSGGVTYLNNYSGTLVYIKGMIPVDNDTYDLGSSSYKWDDIYATNGTIQTSDRNEKNTIVDSDLGLSFVNKLKPVSYKYNGKTRTHYGLIAQDVETVLTDISKPTTDFAGFIKEARPDEFYKEAEPNIPDGKSEGDLKAAAHTEYGLRYGEFISPLIKAVQELSAEVETLKTKVAALEAK